MADQLSQIQIAEYDQIESPHADIETSLVNQEALTDSQTELPLDLDKNAHQSSAPPELTHNESPSDAPQTDHPTAPHIETAVTLPTIPFVHHRPLQSKVVYPNLQQLTDELAATNVTAASVREQIKPFTIAQLNALYSNPESDCVRTFEREFIHNELQTNNNKHALFELLTKYSRCRHALRMNRLDVDALRKALDKDTPGLWRREQKSVKYQATCADGVVVHATESYE